MVQCKLTQSYVQNLKSKNETYRVRDSLLKGFMVIVNSGGKKSYFLDYKHLNGKKSMHKIGDTYLYTVVEAREMARDFLANLASGKDPTISAEIFTYGQFVENIYGPWVVDNRKSGKGTLEMLRTNFDFLFDKPINQIAVAHIEQWRTKRLKKDGMKSSSLNRLVTALKASINWAVKRGIADANPLFRLERLSERDIVPKVRYLSGEERERLMKALDDREAELRRARESHNQWCRERGLPSQPKTPDYGFADHLKPIIILSLTTGIRRNGILSLEWRDVNFNERTLLVRAVSSKNDKQYYVPLNNVAFEALSIWHKQSPKTSPSNYVFPSPRSGKKMTECSTSWENLMKRAEIENFRWHDMRHDFASQLVMNGVDLNTVRELMGHADLKMTLRYAHLAPQIKMSAVETLPVRLSNSEVTGIVL